MEQNDSLDLTSASHMAQTKSDQKVEAKQELVPREQTFKVQYAAPDGKKFSGSLRSKIMDGAQRTMVGRICAEMAGGQAWAKLPPSAAARIYALATLHQQLVTPPEWVLEWAQQDDALLDSVFAKLSEHEAFFFDGVPKEGEEDQRKPRVHIDLVES